jgi:hypothetical protein
LGRQVNLLAQIQEIIRQSDIPSTVKDKTQIHLEAATLDIQDDDGEKQVILKRLSRAFTMIKETDSTLALGKRIWHLISPLYDQVTSFLG